jgi:hypothetical protein
MTARPISAMSPVGCINWRATYRMCPWPRAKKSAETGAPAYLDTVLGRHPAGKYVGRSQKIRRNTSPRPSPMNPRRQCLYKEARPHPGPLPQERNGFRVLAMAGCWICEWFRGSMREMAREILSPFCFADSAKSGEGETLPASEESSRSARLRPESRAAPRRAPASPDCHKNSGNEIHRAESHQRTTKSGGKPQQPKSKGAL